MSNHHTLDTFTSVLSNTNFVCVFFFSLILFFFCSFVFPIVAFIRKAKRSSRQMINPNERERKTNNDRKTESHTYVWLLFCNRWDVFNNTVICFSFIFSFFLHFFLSYSRCQFPFCNRKMFFFVSFLRQDFFVYVDIFDLVRLSFFLFCLSFAISFWEKGKLVTVWYWRNSIRGAFIVSYVNTPLNTQCLQYFRETGFEFYKKKKEKKKYFILLQFSLRLTCQRYGHWPKWKMVEKKLNKMKWENKMKKKIE